MRRTIFFDLGNVLIFFSHQKMCKQVAEYCDLDFKLVKIMMEKYGDLYERGKISSKKIFNEFCHLSQQKLNFNVLMNRISDIFEPNDPVISIALELKKKGHRLFLLSNTCDAHFTFVRAQFPFLKSFDGYILSYKIGARKPEEKIYEKAIEIAECRKDECFYIDDILPYVETARLLEIDAEQYETPHHLIQHLNTRKIL